MSTALADYFGNIKRSVLTIREGLAVTTSYLFRKPVTVQYPDRTVKPLSQMLPKRSRGILEMDSDICTGCLLCMKQCPIDCIYIDVGKDETTKQRTLERFDIDIGKCMYCGICAEVCPTDAIRHTHEFEGGMMDPRRFMLKFISEPRPVAKGKKDRAYEEKPLGSIVRPMLANPWKKGKGSQAFYQPRPVKNVVVNPVDTSTQPLTTEQDPNS
jgi:formate hydrogenlyase subunit 6/NADH:ubiquinone oxidoreductase subunit I